MIPVRSTTLFPDLALHPERMRRHHDPYQADHPLEPNDTGSRDPSPHGSTYPPHLPTSPPFTEGHRCFSIFGEESNTSFGHSAP